GIDDATKNYIFDPFYTTKDSGTGMGLSISFTVIEQHGGLIDVESQPSKGAKFMIYLPINQGDKIGYDSNC
ncbi:two-component sensor histidine kinase, partial [Candidatus Poribacteria bacterium]|nr:two-component sensor histidine kinase [Candidatus Poribacteria bacterium]